MPAPKLSFYRLRPGEKLDSNAALRIVAETNRRANKLYKKETTVKDVLNAKNFGLWIFAKVIANEAVWGLAKLGAEKQRKLEHLLRDKIYFENATRVLRRYNSPNTIVKYADYMDFLARELEIAERALSKARYNFSEFMDEIKLGGEGLKEMNSGIAEANEIIGLAIGIEKKRMQK